MWGLAKETAMGLETRHKYTKRTVLYSKYIYNVHNLSIWSIELDLTISATRS